MTGRNHVPPDSLKPRQESHILRSLIESPPRHRLADDRMSAHQRETQSLLADNQRLAAAHVALKQELSVALQDLRYFSSAAVKIKAERDAEVREVFEKAVKMEAEVRLIDELSADLIQVRGDVQKLSAERKEVNEKLDNVHSELAKEKSKVQEFQVFKSEIEAMHKELRRGRAAIEYEKKVYLSNIEQSEAMEKSKISMTREIEKLKTDLADAEKKAMAVAAAAATNTSGTGYAAGFVNHDMGYVVNAYSGPYAGHQIQGGVNPQYGSGPVTHGSYVMQHGVVDPQYAPGGVPHGHMQHPNPQG